MIKADYMEGDRVEIHSLGPSHGDRVYRGTIRGLSVRDNVPAAVIWIVELDYSHSFIGYGYSHVTMPGACVRPLPDQSTCPHAGMNILGDYCRDCELSIDHQ